MIRIRTTWTGLGGSPHLSTHYFGEDVAAAQTAVDAVRDFWVALQGEMVDDIDGVVEGEVDQIDAATGLLQDRVTVVSRTVGGTSAQDPLPFTTQGLIRLSTGSFVGGREIRGRLFIPGAEENRNTAGRPVAGYIAALNTAAQALIDVSAVAWLVWSKKNGQAPVVTGASAWSEWAVLRSRRD